jgi:amidase
VAERFAAAETLSPEIIATAAAQRKEIRTRMNELLGDNGVLLAPTMPGPAPLRSSTPEEREAFRARALDGLCPAGLAGLPQISIPHGQADGAPVGLALIGPQGADEKLLDLARKF